MAESRFPKMEIKRKCEVLYAQTRNVLPRGTRLLHLMIHAASELIHTCIMRSNNFAQLLRMGPAMFTNMQLEKLHNMWQWGSGYILKVQFETCNLPVAPRRRPRPGGGQHCSCRLPALPLQQQHTSQATRTAQSVHPTTARRVILGIRHRASLPKVRARPRTPTQFNGINLKKCMPVDHSRPIIIL